MRVRGVRSASRERAATIALLCALALASFPGIAGAQAAKKGTRVDWATGSSPSALALADLDDTGYLDVVVANQAAGSVSVFFDDGPGRFRLARSYFVGRNPRAVAVADINGDGLPDVVVANSASNTVSVLLAYRGGSFADAVSYPTGLNPRSLALADVNGDGRIDIVVGNYFDGTASVLLNEGIGGFAPATSFVTGTGPSAVAVADVNGDGRLDIVVANSASNSVSVLPGDGHGGFGARTNVSVGAMPQGMAIADVNGDGRPDCVTANFAAGSVSVLLNNGTGFSSRVDHSCGEGPNAVAVADQDGDGFADIAVSNGRASTVTVLAGDGTGGFGAGVPYGTGAFPVSVALGDVDADGRPEIVAANATSNTFSVIFGDYSAAMGAPVRVAAGSGPSAILVEDLNRDGRQDMLVANYLSNTVSVLCADGAGGFVRRPDVVTGLGPTSLALHDLNGDGYLDLVVANSGSNSVSVFSGDGAGGFGHRRDYATMLDPTCVAVGDVIGDAQPDIVVANQGSNTVSVLLGMGDGTFADQSPWDAGPSPRSVAIGDLNSDHNGDIVVAGYNSHAISILLNVRKSGFAAPVPWGLADINPASVALADLNKDGFLDVVVAGHGTNTLAIFLGNGAGSYASMTSYATGSGARDVAIADVNGDGRLDAVTANDDSGTVSVLLGDGTGALASPAAFTCGDRSWAVSSMEADSLPGGEQVLVVANFGDGTVSLLRPRSRSRSTLQSTPNPSVPTEVVTLTALVSDVAGGVVPTGQVRFFSGTTLLGTATLQSGTATLSNPALGLGFTTISAEYLGDGSHLGSFAAPQAHWAFRCADGLAASFAPGLAFEGDPVTIRCDGVPRVMRVSIGGVPASEYSVAPISYDVESARLQIVATVPFGALSGAVRVEGPCGEAVSEGAFEVRKNFQFMDSRTDHFDWLAAVGWPVRRSLSDTAGVAVGDLQLQGREDYDWRVRAWDPAAQAYAPVERLVVGGGYWIQTRNQWIASVAGTVSRDTTLVLPMPHRGWYLFGNPFSKAVDASSLRVLKRGVERPIRQQTDVQSTVYGWDAGRGGYSAATSIPAGGLFWVRRLSLASAESLLVLPPGSALPDTPQPGAAPDWTVSLLASQGAESTAVVTLGCAALEPGVPHPLTAQSPPPAPVPHLALAAGFPGAGADSAAFQCLIGDRAAPPAWDLFVEQASAPGEFRISMESGRLPAGSHLVLSDPATGYVSELASGRPVTLAALAPARRLRIELLPLGAGEVASGPPSARAYPSPSRGQTGFWFSHPDVADLRVVLFDLAGRQVRVLERRAAPAGESVLVWDGRDDRGASAPAAVYFARCEFGVRRRLLRVVRIQ